MTCAAAWIFRSRKLAGTGARDPTRDDWAIDVRRKGMGYIGYTAKDAVGAISAVRQNNPDVVVLDISLPAGDGFVVAERLQRLVSAAATPMIFMTASENAGSRERAAKAGGAAFLKKPFDATQLANAIETALSPGDDWTPLTRRA